MMAGMNAIYCAPCGLAMRRAAARINQADDLLLNTYRDKPDTVTHFLRDDILSWLSGTVFLEGM